MQLYDLIFSLNRRWPSVFVSSDFFLLFIFVLFIKTYATDRDHYNGLSTRHTVVYVVNGYFYSISFHSFIGIQTCMVRRGLCCGWDLKNLKRF